jgi:hypothetical protein
VSPVCSIFALRLLPQTAAQSVPEIPFYYIIRFFPCQRRILAASLLRRTFCQTPKKPYILTLSVEIPSEKQPF